jgi:hypothetical protein
MSRGPPVLWQLSGPQSLEGLQNLEVRKRIPKWLPWLWYSTRRLAKGSILRKFRRQRKMGNLKFPSVTWMLLDDLLTSWIGKATKTNYKYWFLENGRSPKA